MDQADSSCRPHRPQASSPASRYCRAGWAARRGHCLDSDEVGLADQRCMRWVLGDDPALGQVPPLHLLVSQPGVGRVDQVEVGALPVPHLPARVPRVRQDRRHRPVRPDCTGPVRVPYRVSSRRARDPGVVQGAGDPGHAVPGQPLREHPPDDRRGHRVRFQPVRPPPQAAWALLGCGPASPDGTRTAADRPGTGPAPGFGRPSRSGPGSGTG